MKQEQKQPAIFLDRDGVLNADRVDYVYSAKFFRLLTGVPEALQLLNHAGFKLIIITNQSGIAKGIYSPKAVEQVYELIKQGCAGLPHHMYYCPHHPDYNTRCLCRKPGGLMIEQAAALHNIDKENSWMFGDRNRDLLAGAAAGVPNRVLIGELEPPGKVATGKAGSLLEAVQQLVLPAKK